jgi:hypothetical protein
MSYRAVISPPPSSLDNADMQAAPEGDGAVAAGDIVASVMGRALSVEDQNRPQADRRRVAQNGDSISKNSPRIITEGAMPNIW